MVVFFAIDGTIIDGKTQAIPYSHIGSRVKAMAFQGYVCGGGMKEVKAVAGYVTPPVMEDGIEKTLAHFGLL